MRAQSKAVKAGAAVLQSPQAPLPAMGYLASNWPCVNAENPAVIVNPKACALDLLAWCWGEVQSLHALATALDGEEVAMLYLHRLGPLEEVMHQAITKLVHLEKQPAAEGAL